MAAAYAAMLPCQSRWSSATFSTAPASGRTPGAQCSWKLDSSAAMTSCSGAAVTASSTGQPMLPQAVTVRPAARRIDSSIPVAVVLPLVPVITSHGRDRRSEPVDAPGQLDLADDLDPRAGRGRQHRLGRRDAGGGDHRGGAGRRLGQVSRERDAGAERRQLVQLRLPRAARRDHHPHPAGGEEPHHGHPRDAGPGGEHQVAGRGDRAGRLPLSHRSATASRRRTGRARVPRTSPRAARTAPSPWSPPTRTARSGDGTAPS